MYGILVHHRFLADYQIVALAYTGGLMVSMFEPRSSCTGSNILGKMLISLSVQGGWEGVSVQWTSISSRDATETGDEPWLDGPLGS